MVTLNLTLRKKRNEILPTGFVVGLKNIYLGAEKKLNGKKKIDDKNLIKILDWITFF